MKSKTSFFSPTLFFNILRRFWPLFAAYPVIWLLILPVELNTKLNAAVQFEHDLFPTAVNHIMSTGANLYPILIAVFAVLFAMASFSCFYSSKSVSAVCSLPIKREGLFFSVFLPGPAVILLTNLLVTVITVIVQGAYGAGAAGYALQWFGIVTLQSLFFCGFAAFCASLTGHILVLPSVYLVLNFTFAVVITLIQALLSAFIFGLDSSLGDVTSILSPLAYMIVAGGTSSTYDHDTGAFIACEYMQWTYIAVCAVIGVALVFAAMRLFRIRRMETAGDVVAFKPLKPIFKYCLCLGCALVLGVWLNYVVMGGIGHNRFAASSGAGVLILLACMLAGAFIGYFAAEMLTRKTLRVFAPQRWKGLGVAALVIVALVMLCELDVFGIERRIPDADNVSSVYFFGSFDPIELDEPEQIEEAIGIHRAIVEHKSQHESAYDPTGNAHSYSVNFIYYMKDGSSLDRSYEIYENVENDIEMLNVFLNRPDIILQRKGYRPDAVNMKVFDASVVYYNSETGLYETASLSPDEAMELYNDGIVPDMKEGTIGLVWLNNNDDEYDKTFMDCRVYITFVEDRKTAGSDESALVQIDFNTNVTVMSRNTLEKLRALGIEPVTCEESYRAQKIDEDLHGTDYPATQSMSGKPY